MSLKPFALRFRPTGFAWVEFDGNTAIAPKVTSKCCPGDDTHNIEITPQQPAVYGWGFLRQPHDESTDNLSNRTTSGTRNFWISTT
jgi:hypothetical protein